jgi:hypothetical protein
VVFDESRASSSRIHQLFELCLLDLLAKLVSFEKAEQQSSHPPEKRIGFRTLADARAK